MAVSANVRRLFQISRLAVVSATASRGPIL